MKMHATTNQEVWRDKIAEAQTFVRQYGYSVDRACEMVGLERHLYHPLTHSKIEYLPTPEIIQYECARIRRFGVRPRVSQAVTRG